MQYNRCLASCSCNHLSLLFLLTKGLQWCLLTEEEIVPSIIAMDGRRSRHNKSENQQAVDGSGARSKKGHPPNVADIHLHDANEAKLLRKLEAQGCITF